MKRVHRVAHPPHLISPIINILHISMVHSLVNEPIWYIVINWSPYSIQISFVLTFLFHDPIQNNALHLAQISLDCAVSQNFLVFDDLDSFWESGWVYLGCFVGICLMFLMVRKKIQIWDKDHRRKTWFCHSYKGYSY